MATRAESRLVNETLYDQLATPGMEKQAIDAVNDFTRARMREDGFYRRILPPLQISNDDLDRQVDTDLPVKVVDMEPGSPAAASVPFASMPEGLYILGPRYRVLFNRIMTRRFSKDVDTLRTWVMDIRQVMSDNAIKDMLAEEDSGFINAVNTMLNAVDTAVTATGVVQWASISGGITRNTIVDAFKIMPKSTGRLEVDTVLVNNVTIREIQKWGRDEMGGDFSQDLVKNGWAEREFMNARWIITIKRDLVADDSIFMFADPKFLGKFYLLEDTTMYLKREAFMIEWFAYESLGGAIGNFSAVARADFV
jgi:hypothetical protein